MARIAVVGGGLAGLTAAWQLTQLGADVTLFEASARLGGTVETVQQQGFTVELGPDGWVSEKPWAAELACELGLGEELLPSNDATRFTYILRDGELVPMPDGMRLMVPTDLAATERSPLFSPTAKAAYHGETHRADELRAAAPHHDESVASFVERHFGEEVLRTVAAPLLSGVFGGDVHRLSVRAVMPAFVALEREYGSLILALQAKNRPARERQHSIFTSLHDGMSSLVDALAADLPAGTVRLNTPVYHLIDDGNGWLLSLSPDQRDLEVYDHLILATPAHVTRSLISCHGVPERIPALLTTEATSAVIVAFGFDEPFSLPQGFGFLVPVRECSPLLACTFTDQKFNGRVPAGKRLLRAFFGGEQAPRIAAMSDHEIAALALAELQKILGPMPEPALTLVRRWPQSLPQYAVGHGERMAELAELMKKTPRLHLLGNAYHGVGLPDLVREARALAREIIESGGD